MKILILEDSKALASNLKEVFLEKKWEVNLAFNYKEAFNLIQKECFDLYVIDILLPDNKGYELLTHVGQNCRSSFIFLSGFYDLASILKQVPEHLKPQCHFIKKPFETKDLLNQINDFSLKIEGTNSKYTNFFSTSTPSKNFESYFLDNVTFDTQEIALILLLAHQCKFTGILEILLSNGEENIIEINEGSISKILSPDSESYFGDLLVEYNIALEEDIQQILEDKTSNEPIGQKLLEQELLNPHMLNLILREQIKIRLTQIMSHRSFSAKITATEFENNLTMDLNFNRSDLLEWVIDSLKTKIKPSFLKNFYEKNKFNTLNISSNVKEAFLTNKNFIKKYNEFFKTITPNTSLEELVQKYSKDVSEILQFIYFAVITKSVYFTNSTENEKDIQKLEKIINFILNKEQNNLFQILDLPWKASIEEVSKKYKSFAKILHTDNLPNNTPKNLIKKSEEAFIKIKDSYKLLSNTKQRENYFKEQEADVFLKVIDIYNQAISEIKFKNYKQALELLKRIENNDNKPKDIVLYMAWAKINLLVKDTKIREQLGSIKREIDSCPLDVRMSPLFWFVNGIYYKKIKNYDKSLMFLNKAIKAQKNFREAFEERTLVIKEIREMEKSAKSTSMLSKFFNKKSA